MVNIASSWRGGGVLLRCQQQQEWREGPQWVTVEVLEWDSPHELARVFWKIERQEFLAALINAVLAASPQADSHPAEEER